MIVKNVMICSTLILLFNAVIFNLDRRHDFRLILIQQASD